MDVRRAMVFAIAFAALPACSAPVRPAAITPGYLDVVLRHDLPSGRHRLAALHFELDGRTVCRERHEPPIDLVPGYGTWIWSGEVSRGPHVVSADLELRDGPDAKRVRLSRRMRVVVGSTTTTEASTTLGANPDGSTRADVRMLARRGRSRIAANVPCSVMQGSR